VANYYRQFCGVLEKVTDKEWETLSEWVAPVIETPNFSEKRWRKLLREQPWRDKEHDELRCNFTVEREGEDVFFGEDESGDVDAVAKYVQAFLKKHRTEGYFIMGFADTCDKSRPGGFGGGAVLVTTREISFINSYTWIDEQVKKMKAARRPKLRKLFKDNADSLTVDAAIEQLKELRDQSSLGGKTVVHVCLTKSEIEYFPVARIRLEADKDGATAMVDVDLHGLGAKAP